MKGSLYRERDYAFGQLMLTVRTKLKLTQTELAALLGVRRRAVIDWEGGLTYPTVDHLKQFVVLAIQRQAFPAGREAEEIRALWQASHQKVLFDEMWLGRLLPDAGSAPASKQVEEIAVTAHELASLSGGGPRVDWGDAPDVASFDGRAWELDLLSEWVVQERCRVVSVLGQGGIGKSALATQVMHRVAQDFEVVIWRSSETADGHPAKMLPWFRTRYPYGVGPYNHGVSHLAFGPDGYLYVTGPTTSSFDSIYRISKAGEVEVFYRGIGRPQGVAVDAEGMVYVAGSLAGRRGIVRRDDANRPLRPLREPCGDLFANEAHLIRPFSTPRPG